VVAVCVRLDGIPLALELAAARARTVPLDRLAGGLDDAFRLLTGGARTAMPRQQTLLASIAWSVDLLDDAERAVLRRLAVFRGPFTLDAVEAVAADEVSVAADDVLDVIGRLVDKSLVQLDDATGTYRLLETIRQFSLDRLRDAAELAVTRDRHVAWFADWCVSLGRGEHDFDIGPTHPALPDVFSALDWAYERSPEHAYRMTRALAGVRALLGRYSDFDRGYAWLAARDGSDDPAGWSAAVAGLGHMALTLGRTDYVELVARAEVLLDPDDVLSHGWLRLVQGMLDALQGDGTQLDGVLAIADDEGDDHLQRAVAVPLAIMHACSGELDAADRAISAVQRLLDRRGLPLRLDTGLGVVGLAVWSAALRGDFAAARSLATSGGRPDASMAIVSSCYVSIFAYSAGDRALLRLAQSWQAGAEAALAAESDATNISHNIEGPALQVHCCAALLEGRVDDALALLRRRHATTRVLTPALKSFVLQPLAVRLLAAGLHDELAPHLETLAADVSRLGDPPLPLGHLHYIRALVARQRGDVDVAWEQAHAALDIAHRSGLHLVAIDALHLLAELAARRGHAATSARLFGAVSAQRARIGYIAREVPDPDVVDALERTVDDDQPDARAEGEALTFDDAVAHAQRALGGRMDRPSADRA
jgi:predicted ATPase